MFIIHVYTLFRNMPLYSSLLIVFFIGLFIFLIDFRNSLYIRTVNLQYYVSDIFLPAYCYSFCERMFTFRLCLFIRKEFKIVSQSIC